MTGRQQEPNVAGEGPSEGAAAPQLMPDVELSSTIAPVGESRPEDSQGDSAPSSSPGAKVNRRWWKHAWAVFGAVVGVVGAVTGVIGVVPFLFPDATRPESLTVRVTAVTDEFSPVYAVPLTTDWASFPISSGRCSSAQRSWLQREGTLLAGRYLVSVGNTAGDGATMSLSAFRGKGETGGPAGAIAVVCDQSGAGAGNMRAAVLDPSTGQGAVYVQRDPSLPTNPLVFNLAPGESGQFALVVQSSAAFAGTLVFTGSIGEHVWQQELPVPGGVSVPGVAQQRLIVSDGSLTCEGQPGCDVRTIIAALVDESGTL